MFEDWDVPLTKGENDLLSKKNDSVVLNLPKGARNQKTLSDIMQSLLVQGDGNKEADLLDLMDKAN